MRNVSVVVFHLFMEGVLSAQCTHSEKENDSLIILHGICVKRNSHIVYCNIRDVDLIFLQKASHTEVTTIAFHLADKFSAEYNRVAWCPPKNRPNKHTGTVQKFFNGFSIDHGNIDR